MKILTTYLRPYIKRMSFGLVIKFVGTIMDLFLPWILAYIIDTVIPTKNIQRVLVWGAVMVICSIIAMVTNIIANRMASRVARDTTWNIRHDLFEKVSYLSTSQFDYIGVPSVVSRLTTDTYNINQTIGMMQRIGVRAPILLIGGILITTTLDPVLTLVLIAVMPFTVVTVYLVSRKGIPMFDKMQSRIDRLVQVVRENITGAPVIKALSKESYEIKRFTGVNENLVQAETKANKTMSITPALMNFFLNGGLTLVILVSAYRVNENLTQPGVIVAFLTYFTIILNAMMSITRIFISFSRGLASANRIQNVLREKEQLKVLPTPSKEEIPHKTEIVFDRVSFSYPESSKVLDSISFAVPKGTTLGIIGETGSGKSTIVKLLLRLYDPQKGRIYLRGQWLKTINKEKLHQLFGVVLQRDILFADSIYENIRLGRKINEEQVNQAVERAQAKEFVDKLPEGLDYQLESKGTNLSGGQKQRVLLARALAGPPEILVLDDSSSALDYKTDAKLRKALRELPETTKILIAQRISSIQHADQILVLDQGKIVGLGTHEKLLETCSVYQNIYRSQGGE